ncbi:MAG: hypothetical protein K2J91_04825, partial [Lachnospiraceae bacterium]|nr:hypothetical protein [Lachnospiraceae bacterium]
KCNAMVQRIERVKEDDAGNTAITLIQALHHQAVMLKLIHMEIPVIILNPLIVIVITVRDTMDTDGRGLQQRKKILM